tara:strand:+ start:153809 stop:154696 length:888 start_codon:yes stop_codon:yes gene_type:complete
MMRILFIGSVISSEKLLRKTILLGGNVVGVLTKNSSKLNADFVDLSVLSNKYNIPTKLYQKSEEKDIINWVHQLKPDIIFCFGWSSLLSDKIIQIPPLGVVGFHPTKLPMNRGRHPIIWALALGLDVTASTFFFIDKGIDTGDILSQEEVVISYEDNAQTLYDKILLKAEAQLTNFLPLLQTNQFKKIKQDLNCSNLWRKRSKQDGQIDFRMHSRSIYNLVRALTKPYIGAHIHYKEKDYKVWKVSESNENIPHIEYGKILNITDSKIHVQCLNSSVIIEEHDLDELPEVGEYLL